MIDVNIVKNRKKDYPRLMEGDFIGIQKENQPIVLMLGDGKGIALAGDSSKAFYILHTVMNYDESDFKPFTGTLELRNT